VEQGHLGQPNRHHTKHLPENNPQMLQKDKEQPEISIPGEEQMREEPKQGTF